nr:hypothetical protein [uncultured Sphingomonas sp.]
MDAPCPRSGCTHGATGRCLLNYEPAASCPVLQGLGAPSEEDASDAAEEDLRAPPPGPAGLKNEAADRASIETEILNLDTKTVVANLKPAKPAMAQLSPGRELGLDGLARLASKRPVRLIGLLGSPDAGKTMALVSMYLLAAAGKLKGYEYRNSESAFAFDDLSRGARAWAQGDMLDQIVPHTELADERRPGFLHLRLHSASIGSAVDIAFPDLPGEWTETLINKNVYDRLGFLRNADAIWIFVDGERLANLEFGHDICARTRSAIGRLAEHFPRRVPLKLVVTRADQYDEIPDAVLDPILEEAKEHGYELKVHEIISVDRASKSRSGNGIPELLNASVAVTRFGSAQDVPLPPSPRWMLRYRSETAMQPKPAVPLEAVE